MNIPDQESSPDPALHSRHLQEHLAELARHARADIGRVREPRFQALLETTAEVLLGLRTCYEHYDRKSEPAWQEPARDEA